MLTENSRQLFNRAQQSMPGGVNSPVRAFKNVGGTPLFIKKAKGAYLFDEDNHQYIDYIASWGPMILGHAYEPVIKAIQEKAVDSTSFGAPTSLEICMAELIKSMAPNVDLIRMVSSGTEACMSALRLARGYTGKNKFIKFEGNYHGHADAFLVKAGSGVATFNIQTVPGIPAGVSSDTLTCAYNDLNAVKKLVEANPNEIAAIIVEPVAGNMGCILPEKGFLEGLRKICTDNHIVLIFDEVMTGFRLAPGGAQERLGIDADLITYGKVIGAGMPVGAFGGKKEIMQHIAPLGNVYQAGTLSGNPIAMIAGYTLLNELKNNPSIYQELDDKTAYLHQGLQEVFTASKIPFIINRLGSMISVHFSKQPVTNFETAAAANNELFKQYFHAMLKRGIYLPPSPFESWFLNNALTYQDLDATIQASKESLQEMM
ncbi:MAG: glutamate-1-semialdehyde 2,1-aminomutase [Hydrotalea flava]|uniref:glutamate-1-semialdehyde 2,1-aminomutase n=1 Tax=Hydrotalea TaxID=1004300 RepID=UPI00094408FD|nr:MULTISPECIES: glutamate-1-semialdehyde 2,1-aminomutase [Hydrotalea]MBY0349184.1 glutamate-1-semialdehyde 2,1-aminomutase [Hydrotalea flava]NIM34421.1 glutamate-1-semialdehyde 2,1-aminomutase [Hydrotalea flava]NIM36874.1 glutamate-1-semialdehyde 2,1-aminomutase [Hydrotalea flava]NIN02440.1 glutamate-1-semialdehyde 2,1-aminomutase [Hydrotalea flava]NIN13718.1 glutamate-1-semialdehyde 2,1-aminomutase [Hydrotalea flava]